MKGVEKLTWLNVHKLIVADAYGEIKNYEKSINILKEILKSEPDYEMIHHRLYYSLLKMGKKDKAEEILSEGLLSFDDKDLLNDAGVYFAERGFTNTAFIFFLESLFKGASNSGENLKKLTENEILNQK
jgi:tetratricopeptide (TPR) repeat protein